MAKLAEVALVLKRISAAYGQVVSEDQARAYHGVLGRFPRLVLVGMMWDVVGKSKFFPRAAEMLPVAEKILVRYIEPADCHFDEAARWVMFKRNYVSTDELMAEDVAEVYREMRPGAPVWLAEWHEEAVAHV